MTLLVVVWALLVSGATATAIVRASIVRPVRRSPELLACAVVVRPCAGHEEGLGARLRSRGGARRFRFAVESALDPAATTVHAAARELSRRGAHAMVAHTFARGPNHKADQLARALRAAPLGDEDIVIVADSDVDLSRADLAALVAPLDDARVGASWAPPAELGRVVTGGDAVAHAVLAASLHAFPLLAHIDRSGMVGKLFAVRASALRDAGGFSALVDRLGEDVALARGLRRAGWRVALAPVVAPTTTSGRLREEVVARLSRWVRVVRSERPWLLPSYPLLFAPLPLAAVVAAFGAAAADAVAILSAGLVVASRLAVAHERGRGALAAARDAVAGDRALLSAFASALVHPTFAWRGRRLRLGPGGRLREARAREPREEALGDAREPRRPTLVDDLEVGEVRGVDARELGRDAVALLRDPGPRIARGREGRTDRDPELGRLVSGEDVADADGHDARARGEAADVRGSGEELERRERGALSALRVDEDRSARPVEERRGVPHRPRAVARVLEVDPEGADEPEEREPLEVSGIHHRVGLEPQLELGEPERDERIPPCRVVRDEEERRLARCAAGALEAVQEHAPEPPRDALLRLSGEPTAEPARAPCGDHERGSR